MMAVSPSKVRSTEQFPGGGFFVLPRSPLAVPFRVGLWRRGNPRSSNRHPGNCAAALSTPGRGQSR